MELNFDKLQSALLALPQHYNFELLKTISHVSKNKFNRVVLQFPEGLLIYAQTICQIIEDFTKAECCVLGDVTYGACCIEDVKAKEIGADLLIHYGHSCLVPIQDTVCKVLYVFVTINIDSDHLVSSILANFNNDKQYALMGTVQFLTAVHAAHTKLSEAGYDVILPQSRPLSKGEVLGCTSPRLDNCTVIFISDGRFHLESVMIQNPLLTFYRYDPFTLLITHEVYEMEKMKKMREFAMIKASKAKKWGIIQGTLGRQGNPHVVDELRRKCLEKGISTQLFLMSEINLNELLKCEIDAFVQISCPRLSIDWAHESVIPLLNTYEAYMVLGNTFKINEYPMDFYSHASEGPWSIGYFNQPKRRKHLLLSESSK
eukprot:NODE_470_length_8086_cov_0.567422.p3 type:complete len:373 gc:universal NODE_470_length_8086_cov_0.567422:5671-4553(-)